MYICIRIYAYIHTYIYIYIYDPMVIMSGSSFPGRVIPKTQKWYLIPPCRTLNIIMYGSRVRGSIKRKESRSTLYLGQVTQLIYIYIYIYIYRILPNVI